MGGSHYWFGCGRRTWRLASGVDAGQLIIGGAVRKEGGAASMAYDIGSDEECDMWDTLMQSVSKGGKAAAFAELVRLDKGVADAEELSV